MAIFILGRRVLAAEALNGSFFSCLSMSRCACGSGFPSPPDVGFFQICVGVFDLPFPPDGPPGFVFRMVSVNQVLVFLILLSTCC